MEGVISYAQFFSTKCILPRDGNGYEIFACPRIANPISSDTGLSLCPRARVWLKVIGCSSLRGRVGELGTLKILTYGSN